MRSQKIVVCFSVNKGKDLSDTIAWVYTSGGANASQASTTPSRWAGQAQANPGIPLEFPQQTKMAYPSSAQAAAERRGTREYRVAMPCISNKTARLDNQR
jgi:hypothetical protein